MVPSSLQTWPVMVMLLNLLQLSAKNLFIRFPFSTWLHLCKYCAPNPNQNRDSKPSTLVSDELVTVLLKKLKRTNRQSKCILDNRYSLSKISSSIPKFVLQNYMNHYSFGFLVNWWLSAQLCCVVFQEISVSCVLISRLKFSYRIDCKLRI